MSLGSRYGGHPARNPEETVSGRYLRVAHPVRIGSYLAHAPQNMHIVQHVAEFEAEHTRKVVSAA